MCSSYMLRCWNKGVREDEGGTRSRAGSREQDLLAEVCRDEHNIDALKLYVKQHA